jgi:transcriptional regulator with AAA-type ATPase domain
MPARLIVRRGTQALLEYTLRPGRVLIGRSDSCDLVIPDSGVSRTHCVLSGNEQGWSLRDRSRHGTVVNGQTITESISLTQGTLLQMGPFVLEFTNKGAPQPPTSSHVLPGVPAEQLVAPNVVERAVLVVEDGPMAGQRFPLNRSRVRIGAQGTDGVVINDPTVVVAHLTIELARGRPMLVPGAGSAVLEGERITGRTPLWPGERVRIGDTELSITTDLFHEEAEIGRGGFGEMVGASHIMQNTFSMMRRVARHNAPVLLFGESGTGKELASRGMHEHSPRAEGPFVAINCGAITEALFESELFGHEKGSFTGASQRRDGAFHKAHKGTLLLDEIGELPEAAQVKLLRTLETGEVRRVGSHEITYPDVRLVAATNRDLHKEVAAGRFRSDLFFRLAVLPVRLPALRERPADLPVIAKTLAQRMNAGVTISPAAMEMLSSHSFPGNVRELRNVLTRAYVLGGTVILPEFIQFSPWSYDSLPPTAAAGLVAEPNNALMDSERALLQACSERLQGNRSAMSRELGVARSTLIYKLRKYGLD